MVLAEKAFAESRDVDVDECARYTAHVEKGEVLHDPARERFYYRQNVNFSRNLPKCVLR